MSLFSYTAPESLDEAIAVLAGDSSALPLAGGYTVLLPANRGRIAGALLVDLRKLQALAGVALLADGSLKIGAATTLSELGNSELVREQVRTLSEAALLAGDAQVRNRATIGGNIAASDIGADLPPVLLALKARILVQGPNGSREITADEFFAKPALEVLGRDELIVAILIPAAAGRFGVAYEKFRHPATLFALCGVAASVRLTPNGALEDVRVTVTGAIARPERLRDVEAALLGQTAEETSIHSAARGSGSQLSFIDDLFASAEYRGHLTRVLTERALKRAIAAATA